MEGQDHMPCCASHLGGERGSVVICFSAEPQKPASAYWGSLGEARITGKRKGPLDVPSLSFTTLLSLG
ncbi:hypothetical protein ACRRTK_023215 [Alexandromys fortis]